MIQVKATKINPKDKNFLIPCELDDPDVEYFYFSYPNMPCGLDLQIYAKKPLNKYHLEQIVHAMERCFAAGKEARSREIRSLLGC